MQTYSISIYLDIRRKKENGKFPVKLRVYGANMKKRKLYSTKFNLTKNEFDSILGTSKPRKREYKEIRLQLKALEAKANKIAEKIDYFSFDEFEKRMFSKIGDSSKLAYHYA